MTPPTPSTLKTKTKHENAINGKQKDSVQKEMLAASAMMRVSVERKHNRLLLLPDRRHKMTEEDLRKEVPPEAVVRQEGDVKKRAESPSKETERIRRVTIGILPYAKVTNLNRRNVRIQAHRG